MQTIPVSKHFLLSFPAQMMLLLIIFYIFWPEKVTMYNQSRDDTLFCFLFKGTCNAATHCVTGTYFSESKMVCTACSGACFSAGKLRDGNGGCTVRCGSRSPSNANTVNPSDISCLAGAWKVSGSTVNANDICKDNWVCHTNGKCYKLFTSTKTWTAANSDCAS